MADGLRPSPDMFLSALGLVLLVDPKLLSWNSSVTVLEKKVIVSCPPRRLLQNIHEKLKAVPHLAFQS